MIIAFLGVKNSPESSVATPLFYEIYRPGQYQLVIHATHWFIIDINQAGIINNKMDIRINKTLLNKQICIHSFI